MNKTQTAYKAAQRPSKRLYSGQPVILENSETPAQAKYGACGSFQTTKRGEIIKISNEDFICTCALCGRETYAVSFVEFRAGYGSKHDTETHTVILCGDCFDAALNDVYNRLPVGVVEVKGLL